MRRIALLLAVVLVLVACGDDDTATTTQPTGSTATSSTNAGGDTTSSTDAPTTTTGTESASEQCTELWPEELVQQVTGVGFEFFEQNVDGTACTYTALPDSIALAWRTDDLAGLEISRGGAELTGTVADSSVCDAGFLLVIQGALVIVEGYSAAQGRVYTATVSGLDIQNGPEWAEALIEAVC